jgi:hypothetical protein
VKFGEVICLLCCAHKSVLTKNVTTLTREPFRWQRQIRRSLSMVKLDPPTTG